MQEEPCFYDTGRMGCHLNLGDAPCMWSYQIRNGVFPLCHGIPHTNASPLSHVQEKSRRQSLRSPSSRHSPHPRPCRGNGNAQRDNTRRSSGHGRQIELFAPPLLSITFPPTELQTSTSWSNPALTMMRWEGLYSTVTTPRLWPFITDLHCCCV